jgi:DNA polymerase-1
MTLSNIHDFELSLVPPCMAILERGVRIDESRRLQMVSDLDKDISPRRSTMEGIVVPLLTDQTPKRHLFREKWTCHCCKGGSIKAQACWSCAGYTAKPGKRALAGKILGPCRVCDGEGRRTVDRYNPDSDQQTTIALYTLLKLPKRTRHGKLRVDEEALKDLLVYDRTGLVSELLATNKAATIVRMLDRMKPGADGRLRTWLNPAGTETGRFSSAETFLEVSTNMQNLAKKVAAKENKYNVRQCIVPNEGETFIEADLSQAEARIVAALCNDEWLLERWADHDFDVHTCTAANIFDKSESDVSDSERHLGKTARHALNYGMGWSRFMSTVNGDADLTGVSITARDAKRIVAAYRLLHPRLANWWGRVAAALHSNGTLETVYGRRRTFFGRRSSIRSGTGEFSDTVKEAIAFVPQSTVADLLNRGLLRWWKQYDPKIGRLQLQIHDAILLGVPKERRIVATKLVTACLEEEIEINKTLLKIPVDVKWSDESWADVHK